jgi:hypothetical protein
MTAHNQDPITEPIPRITSEKEKEKKLSSKKFIAALALAGVVSGGAAFALSGGENKEVKAGSQPVATAEAVPGAMNTEQEVDYSKIDVQTLTVDEFYDDATYPQEQRIKWANEIIEQRQDAAYAEINTFLKEHSYPELGPLVDPAEDNTGNEIMVQHAVINYIASTAPTISEGQKILAATADAELRTLDDAIENIGENRVVSAHTVAVDSATSKPIESPIFTQIAVGDYKPNGVPSKVLSIGNIMSGENSQIIVRFVGGRYITHSVLADGDPDWISYPEQLADK